MKDTLLNFLTGLVILGSIAALFVGLVFVVTTFAAPEPVAVWQRRLAWFLTGTTITAITYFVGMIVRTQ